jgi:hypothetical protein
MSTLISFSFYLFFAVLGTESKSSSMLCKCSTSELHPCPDGIYNTHQIIFKQFKSHWTWQKLDLTYLRRALNMQLKLEKVSTELSG